MNQATADAMTQPARDELCLPGSSSSAVKGLDNETSKARRFFTTPAFASVHGSGPRQHEQLTQKVTLGSLEKVGRGRGVNLETQP